MYEDEEEEGTMKTVYMEQQELRPEVVHLHVCLVSPSLLFLLAVCVDDFFPESLDARVVQHRVSFFPKSLSFQ